MGARKFIENITHSGRRNATDLMFQQKYEINEIYTYVISEIKNDNSYSMCFIFICHLASVISIGTFDFGVSFIFHKHYYQTKTMIDKCIQQSHRYQLEVRLPLHNRSFSSGLYRYHTIDTSPLSLQDIMTLLKFLHICQT